MVDHAPKSNEIVVERYGILKNYFQCNWVFFAVDLYFCN